MPEFVSRAASPLFCLACRFGYAADVAEQATHETLLAVWHELVHGDQIVADAGRNPDRLVWRLIVRYLLRELRKRNS
jgi:hypothetical protein